MHFFKALTRGGTPCAIVVKVEYLRRVQSNRLHLSREGDTSHAWCSDGHLLLAMSTAVIRFRGRYGSGIRRAILVSLPGSIRILVIRGCAINARAEMAAGKEDIDVTVGLQWKRRMTGDGRSEYPTERSICCRLGRLYFYFLESLLFSSFGQ
jgi:hypothetical protein